MTCAAIVLT